MRQYLSTIHTKSPSHKKRFALATSSGVTLAIFAIWAVVRFGGEPQIAVETTGPVNLAATLPSGAFETIWESMKSTWQSLTDLNGK